MEIVENTKRHSVGISEIIELRKRISEINSFNIHDVVFIGDNGEILDIPKYLKDEFGYTGLSLCDFITTGFYKDGYSEE